MPHQATNTKYHRKIMDIISEQAQAELCQAQLSFSWIPTSLNKRRIIQIWLPFSFYKIAMKLWAGEGLVIIRWNKATQPRLAGAWAELGNKLERYFKIFTKEFLSQSTLSSAVWIVFPS